MSNKGNVLISAISLILGITSVLFITFYVQHQLSYDGYHHQADNIYRVVLEVGADGASTHYATTGKPLGPKLSEDYPEVEAWASLHSLGGKVTVSTPAQQGGQHFNETHMYAVNQEAFSVFDFTFVEGSTALALQEPLSIVLCQTLAKKYFGDAAALGQRLQVNGTAYRVTGVMEDLPANTHLSLNALLTEAPVPADYELQDWFDLEYYTYILLKDGSGKEAFVPKLKQLAEAYLAPVMEDGSMQLAFHLQPLQQAHFSEGLIMDQPTSNKAYSYLFMVLAFLILLIACFNYINLSMALALKRGKEIGIRRVLGGDQKNLVQQLAFESFCISLFSLLVSSLLIIYLFPIFKWISALEVDLMDMLDWKFLVLAAAVFFFVAMVGGLYPVLYLAKLEPVEALKNKRSTRGGGALHKTLLSLQFAASLIMLICTLALREQMLYVQQRDLGFTKERLLLVDLPEDIKAYADILRIKESLEEHTFIEGVSLSGYGSLPGMENGKDVVEIWAGGKTSEKVLNVFSWDEQVVPLLGLEISQGRNFSSQITTDQQHGVLVNEQLVKELGWQEPLSQKIDYKGERQVIGVVKNFHYASLHNKLEPAIIIHQDEYLQKLLVKVRQANIPLIKAIWEQQLPDFPFEYSYLDDLWDSQYAGDQRLMLLFTICAALAMLLACLGLLGLSTFTVQQRKKEIGIRRVLGARFKDIFFSISKEFGLVLLSALLIALPVAYYLAAALQEEFPYRAGIGMSTYIIALLSLLSLVVATILYSVGRGVTSRPIHFLKEE